MMKFPSRITKSQVEAPREKLTTIFQIRNLGTNFSRQLDAIVEAVDKQVFSFRTLGLLFQGEHHQVTEFVVRNLELAKDPDLKIHIEKARMRNGVTSFGAGPDFGNPMLVFEVIYMYYTFDWSNLEMPMPIVGRCLIAVGEERQLFPGPKFPMSHQLHGFGSEMDMGTTHNIAGSGRRLEFRAEFKQAAWIHQEAYFRIVVPGMYVPSFLPLSLQILGKRSSDNMLKEPFHLTNIRVDLLEFSCVPSKYTEATDIRSKVLFEKETSMEINSLNSKLMIPPTMYDCVIPQVGPTFFIGGFTRTYGLKITLSICNKRVPRFNVSAFIELHVAQKRYERIHEQEIYNPLWHFLGCNKDEMARGQDHFMKSLQDFESNDACLSTFSRNFASNEATDKFQRYFFLLHQHGGKGCFIVSADIMTGSSRIPSDSSGVKETRFCQSASSKIHKWLRSHISRTSLKCICPCWETRVIDLPTFGTGTGFDKPHSAICIVVDGHVIEANSPKPFMRGKPLFPYPSYPFGEENIPLSIRVSLNGNTQFYQSREGSYDGIASPGMELNKFVRCTFIVAQGFKEASQYRQVDDIEFCLEQIKITLEEEKLEDDELSSKEIPLLDDRKSRFIRWSEFKDAVAGSELARAMTLPPHFFQCKIPNHLKPFVMCTKMYFSRGHRLRCRLLVCLLGRRYTFEWSRHLYLTTRDTVGH